MNVLVFGVRGQGKSTLAYYLAEKSKRPIAVYDVSHRFNAWPECVVSTPDDLEDLIDRAPRVVYQPENDAYEEFGEFSEILWERQLTLLIDEASELQEPQARHWWLHKWIRMHPLERVDVIQTLHAPADSWARCRSLANDWYIFATWRPQDLKAIAEHCGDDVAAEVTRLEQFQYLHFDVAKRQTEKSGNPQIWFREITGQLVVAGGLMEE
jgi:hypothetical protein